MSSKIGTLILKGASGTEYKFLVYPIGTSFKSIGGVYYISKRTKKSDGVGGTHSQVYIGETGDLSERFDNHHKADCFVKNNANCISVHTNNSKTERLYIEKDLIDNYNPSCNG